MSFLRYFSAKTQVAARVLFLSVACFLTFISSEVFAQNLDFVGPVLPSAAHDDETAFHEFHPAANPLDSLFLNYVPAVDIELVQDRATCMDSDIPLVVNETVCGFINYFTVRRRGYTRTMLEKKHFYYPIFEYYLKQYKMPDALKHLAIVESGLNYNAKSPAGAVGLWQFMPGTGKQMNLNQNNHIDERQNPWLATEAACKYLKSLHNMFHDWELALAAYNCGPGNVLKAQRRSGKTGFWEIYGSLPKETRSYVPQFYAVVYAMHFAREHNIFPDVNKVLTFTALDTFRTDKSCNLEKLESILGLNAGVLLRHNHDLKSNYFPGGTLLIPETHSGLLDANFDRFMDSAKFAVIPKVASRKQTGSPEFTRVFLKKGSDIRLTARKYGMSYQSFCKLNKLWGKQIIKSRNYLVSVPQKDEEPTVLVSSAKPGNQESSDKQEKNNSGADLVSNPSSSTIVQPEVLSSESQKQAAGKEKVAHNDRHKASAKEVLAGENKIIASAKIENQTASVHQNQKDADGRKPDKAPEKLTVPTEKCQESDPKAKHYYEVKLGDGLYNIARMHGMSLEQIKEFNPDLGKHIFVGQKIRVNTTSGLAVSDSVKEKGKESSGRKTFTQLASSVKPKVRQQIRPKMYTVQKGDTLYSITKKFNRLTVKDLIKLNKLKNNQIKPGQSLIIG